MHMINQFLNRACLIVAGLLSVPSYAAVIEIEALGAGFVDPTVAIPVDGNTGETLGEQRLIAVKHAAALMGAKIQSNVPILVRVEFDSLSCQSNTVSLGGMGPASVHRNFLNAPMRDTWYPQALANSFAGYDLHTNKPDIVGRFNSEVDSSASCVPSKKWYYGLEGQPHDGQIDFVAVAVHELIHGLGFSTQSSPVSGRLLGDTPTIYDHFLYDPLTHSSWADLPDNLTRKQAASQTRRLMWNGDLTRAAAPNMLHEGYGFYGPYLHTAGSSTAGVTLVHWDLSMQPDGIMEPSADNDVHISLGIGLSICQLADIGWELADGIDCPNGEITTSLVDLTPRYHDFGAINVDGYETLAVTFTSMTTGPIEFKDPMAMPLTTFELLTNTCSKKVFLIKGETCELLIGFSPGEATRYQARMAWPVVSANKSIEVELLLSGRGKEVDPNTILAVSSNSQEQAVVDVTVGGDNHNADSSGGGGWFLFLLTMIGYRFSRVHKNFKRL